MNRKLVVFVPHEALDSVRDALFAAGAGRIGDYERCSWYTEGTGTFFAARRRPERGGEGTGGARARAASRDGVPGDRHDAVIAALRLAHPYEEPAFDVYPLL